MLTVSTEDQLSFTVRNEVVFTRSGNEFPCAAGEGQRTAPKNVLVEWLRCELYWSVLLLVVAAGGGPEGVCAARAAVETFLAMI